MNNISIKDVLEEINPITGVYLTHPDSPSMNRALNHSWEPDATVQ
jgi:hypothetical protein